MMEIWKRIVLLTIFSSLVMAVCSGFQSGFKIQNSGLVITINLGVFEDQNLTIPTTSILWPTLTPGDNASHVLYVKNEGSTPVILHMNTSDWNPPEASTYLFLSWDREDQILHSGVVIKATLVLHVSPEIQGIFNYGFAITLIGEVV